MPKFKTRKGVAKRFRVTKHGKVKRSKAAKSHLLTKKSGSRKRKLRRPGLITGSNKEKIKRFLGK